MKSHLPPTCIHLDQPFWAIACWLVLLFAGAPRSSAQGPISLLPGQALQGKIAPGEQNLYTFAGVTGSKVTLIMGATTSGNGCTLNPQLQLYAPDGSLVTNLVGSCFTGTPAEISNLVLAQTGNYEIICAGATATQSGGYVLDLLQHPSGNQNDHPISPGQHLTATVAVGTLDSYTFAGLPGERVTISMGAATSGNGCTLNPVIQLYTPDGSLLTNAVGGCFTATAAELPNLTLSQTGTYQIVCRAGSAVQSGGYTLDLLQHSAGNQNDRPIQFGQKITSTLTAQALDSYQFTGSAGQQVTISMGASSAGNGCTINPWFQLYSPDGTLITNVVGSCFTATPAELANFSLPQTGSYQIVCRGGTAVQSGAYTLVLLEHPAGNQNDQSILASDRLTGTISAEALDSYTFFGAAGERVSLSMGASSSGNGCTLNPWLQLYGPDGRLITNVVGGCFTGTPAALANFSLPLTGIYQAVCRGGNAVQIGAYALSYLVLFPAQPILGWATLAPITYGTPLNAIAQLNATANTQGKFKYSLKDGTPIDAGTILNAGTYSLVATFNPSDTTDYVSNTTTNTTLTVLPARLTVTGPSVTKVYGPANPGPLVPTYSGFVNGDTPAVISGSPLLTNPTTSCSPVGTYPITVSQGTLNAANYTFTFVPGVCLVTPAPLTITANNLTKPFGSTFPTGPGQTTGFAAIGLVCSDSVSSVTLSSPGAPATAPAKSYPLTPSAAVGTGLSNYQPASYVPGTLTVTNTGPVKVATPLITPNGGTFSGQALVTLTCSTPGATIYYTLGGSDPTANSTLYSNAFTLTASATLEAQAFVSGDSPSDIAVAKFSISGQTAATAPIFTPAGGTYKNSVLVTLSCPNAGATIRYTLDGTDPTPSSSTYTYFIALTNSAVIKAQAAAPGFLDSPVSTASFTINRFIPSDFSSDGVPDVVLQDTNGFLNVWFMNTNGVAQSTSNYPVPTGTGDPGWQLAGCGDFSASGNVDLLFQYSDGSLAVWRMKGTNMISSEFLNPSNSGVGGWRALAVADFDGDGESDILFQSASGDLAVWFMDDLSLSRAALLNPKNPGPGWTAVGAGDFNGDGKVDVLFQYTDGSLAVWLLTNQTDLQLPLYLTPSTTGDPNWTVVGVTDLNGDGSPDLLFQNQKTGDLAIWYMNRTTMVRASLLTPSNPGGSWKLKAP